MRYPRLILFVMLVSSCFTASAAGRPDRGVTTLGEGRTPFMVKGAWTLGGSASGSSYSLSDYGLPVITGIGGEGYNMCFKPTVTLAVRNDMSVGVYGRYGRKLVNLGEDMYSLGHDYGGALFLRKYLPLGNAGRFALFADLSLQAMAGQEKIYDLVDGYAKGSYQTSLKMSLGVNPGAAMFITSHLMLSADIGIAGIGYSWADQIHNQATTGERNGFYAYYILNIFDLSVGLHYCF